MCDECTDLRRILQSANARIAELEDVIETGIYSVEETLAEVKPLVELLKRWLQIAKSALWGDRPT